mgnify:CR=1 FL=1
MKKVSVIIPTYNEQNTLIEILESVNSQDISGVEFEIVIIDDGSSDQTVTILESRPDLYSKFIKLEKNSGKGAAVAAGLEEASGDYVLFQDADLEYDPADYSNLLLPVLRFDADLVLGSRFVAPKYTRVSYFWHKLGNRFITFLFNIVNNTTFTDIYSCYLLYRRSLIKPQQLKSRGWEQHAEILSLAVAGSQGMYEVPISYHGRTYKEGKKIKAYHIVSVLWMIMKMRIYR